MKITKYSLEFRYKCSITVTNLNIVKFSIYFQGLCNFFLQSILHSLNLTFKTFQAEKSLHKIFKNNESFFQTFYGLEKFSIQMKLLKIL